MSNVVEDQLRGVFAVDRACDFHSQQPSGPFQSGEGIRPVGGIRGVCWSDSGDCHAKPARVWSRLDLHHRQVMQALIGHPRKDGVQRFRHLPAELQSLSARSLRFVPRFIVERPGIASIFETEFGRGCPPPLRVLSSSLQRVYSGRGTTCLGSMRISVIQSGTSEFLLPGSDTGVRGFAVEGFAPRRGL